MTVQTSIAKAVALRVVSQYSSIWGFVNTDIKEGFVDSALILEVKGLANTGFLENKSAEFLGSAMVQWREEAIKILLTKHAMPI